MTLANADGEKFFGCMFIVCPNAECGKFTLTAQLHRSEWSEGNQKMRDVEKTWQLVPSSKAKILPSYLPKAIIEDYEEACLIAEPSPKASATLSRRCLQGIIRDFWKVRPGRLVDEIKAIEDRVDPLTWEAIDSVRKVGNIGAHMEKDINLIIEVEPYEADLLIGLIETLIDDWYVARQERKKRLNLINSMASDKKP